MTIKKNFSLQMRLTYIKCIPIIEFKDGRMCGIHKEFDSYSFYKAVKGKTKLIF